MIAGIAAPLCVWIFLPFLRGTRVRDDNYSGLLRVSKARLLGVFGAPNDADDYIKKVFDIFVFVKVDKFMDILRVKVVVLQI